MSIYELRSLWCAQCGLERTVKAVDSANPVRHPPFLDEVLDRSFLVSSCLRCGHAERLEGPVLWTDVPCGLVAWMAPAAGRPLWSSMEVEVATGLEVPTREEGPGFVRTWGRRSALRLVFGHEELREKVVAAHAGLDDRLVEALKLPFGDAESCRGPVLEAVDDRGLLLAEPDPPHAAVAVVSWDAYRSVGERLGTDPSLAGLADATWVHWLRAPFPRHAAI